MKLETRHYLVVGGGSGIGLELTKSLVADGARVTVWSRSSHDELDELGVEHQSVDVTRPIEPDSVDVPDNLDGLVYCPGSITLGAFNRLTDEAFVSDFTVNCLGAVRVLHLIMPALTAGGGGAVVLFSSVAVETGLAFHASVAAAKAAVEGLARSLAAEYAPRQVRFNVVAPSLTDTPLAAPLLSSEKKRDSAAERHPLKRTGSATEIAAAARYLVGPESGWVTGQVLHVDGGMSSLR